MSQLAREFAADMANQGLGVFDTADPADRTIFYGEMPTEVLGLDEEMHPIVEALLIVPVASPPPQQYIDTEYPIFDVWAKSPHTDRAYAMLQQVYDIYHRRYHWDAGNWHIYWSRALGTIVDADRDLEGSKLLRLSVQFVCRNLNTVS